MLPSFAFDSFAVLAVSLRWTCPLCFSRTLQGLLSGIGFLGGADRKTYRSGNPDRRRRFDPSGMFPTVAGVL
jgi:hypothetical protein